LRLRELGEGIAPSGRKSFCRLGDIKASLKTINMFFGRVMTTEELLNEMRSELGRNDRVAAE
jgi:hypothetical protein